MQKIISIVLSFLLIAGMEAMGQDITTRLLTLTAPPPPTVKQVSTTVVGNPGNATYYYWVVAKYASGNANPSAAAIVINAPNTLSVSTYIRVNWDAVAGATGYDVLRTTTASIPNGDCACAVVTATASTTVNDQGAALGAYTVNSQTAASSSCNLDNLSSATPVVTCAPYGWTPGGAAGGALTGTYPNPLIANVTTPGAVPFVSATPGVLTQSPTGLFYDSANVRLGLGTATPTHRIGIATAGTDGIGIKFSGNQDLVFSLTANISTGEIRNNAFTNYFPTFWANNAERARITNAGNFLLGTTTDGNYKLDIAASGSSGTLRVYDQTATTGSTSLVVRAGAGQSGNLLTIQNNAGSAISYMDVNGSVIATGSFVVSADNAYQFNGRSLIYSPSNGVLRLADNAGTDFNRLQFGGTTSSFPALKRSSAGVQVRLADDSAFTTIQASNYISNDGSTGITGATCSSFKNGICVAP